MMNFAPYAQTTARTPKIGVFTLDLFQLSCSMTTSATMLSSNRIEDATFYNDETLNRSLCAYRTSHLLAVSVCNAWNAVATALLYIHVKDPNVHDLSSPSSALNASHARRASFGACRYHFREKYSPQLSTGAIAAEAYPPQLTRSQLCV